MQKVFKFCMDDKKYAKIHMSHVTKNRVPQSLIGHNWLNIQFITTKFCTQISLNVFNIDM